jgi:hypothetical protein
MAPWRKNKAKASLVRREMGSVHEARAPQQKAFMGCIGSLDHLVGKGK